MRQVAGVVCRKVAALASSKRRSARPSRAWSRLAISVRAPTVIGSSSSYRCMSNDRVVTATTTSSAEIPGSVRMLTRKLAAERW